MHPYPHVYRVSATGGASGAVATGAAELPEIAVAPPVEFDGPGGHWSPETLLVAAVADCFVLSFRGVARASRFEWQSLHCEVEGVLDKAAGVAQFTEFRTTVTLKVAAGTDAAKAHKLLETAERVCLIANSLKGARRLECQVVAGSSSA